MNTTKTQTQHQTQEQSLQAILEKTSHVRGGIAAQDLDIVDNALAERGELIAAYASAGFGPAAGECAKTAAAIAAMDEENSLGLKKLMDGCNEKIFEARRELKKLQAGKKAANQYLGGAGRGGAFDSKR